MIRTLITASALALTLAIASPATAQQTAITGAKVWTGTQAGTLENATVLFDRGRIVAVGTNVTVPAGATQIAAEGRWVTPGIISPLSQTGLSEVSGEGSTNDASAGGSAYSVALDASLAFNPAATPIAVTRLAGVTRLVVTPAPGSSIFAGQGFVADTSGNPDSVTRVNAFVHVTLGEGGADTAGGSRPAAWAFFYAALSDARTFPARYAAHNEGDALTRVDAQAFGPASRGQQLMLIEVQRASDLREVISLSRARPELRLAVVGAAEGWQVAAELAEADIPVIINPFANLPDRFETLGATLQNAKRLIDAGVTVAFVHGRDEAHQARLVLQAAGNAVANGVAWDDAMAALTTAPAEIFGLDGLGRLAPGAVADVVMWDGDPLEVTSTPVRVFINGQDTAMESRQTKLRDRYLSLTRGDKPLAYRKP
jgi:imidazolonepropionase-like amidohydrolase